MTLEEIEKLCAAVEEMMTNNGEWIVRKDYSGPQIILGRSGLFFELRGHIVQVWNCNDELDGCFEIAEDYYNVTRLMAASRTIIPELVERVRKLEKVVEAAKDYQDYNSNNKCWNEYASHQRSQKLKEAVAVVLVENASEQE